MCELQNKTCMGPASLGFKPCLAYRVDAPEQVSRHAGREDAVDAHDAVGQERVRDGGAALCSRVRRADGSWPVRGGGGGSRAR